MAIPNKSRREWFGWLVAEFIGVFLSIVVTFIAEDWRQAQNDRGQAREVLKLMYHDLEADLSSLMLFRKDLKESEKDGVRVLERLQTDIPPESLAVLLRQV